MAVLSLLSLAGVRTAIDGANAIHGAYQAVNILARVLSQVDEPDDFAAEVKRIEQQQGPSYDGPEDAGHQIVKAVKTAGNSEGEARDALLDLTSTVITKLGASQGARVVSLLLLACGVDPTLTVVVIKLYVLLAQTESGREIVARAAPQMRAVLESCKDKAQVVQPIQQLATTMGDKGADLVAAITRTPVGLATEAIQKGGAAFIDLLDGKRAGSGDGQADNA